MASGWSPGIAIFERGRSTRRLLHLNIFTTQWHCSDDFRTGLGPFPYNSIFMTHVYRSRKEVPWRTRRSKRTTNLRDRPTPPISNANTTATSSLRDARQFFTTELTKGCVSRYDEGIACFQGWLSVVIKM